MDNISVNKLNESYSYIDGPLEQLRIIHDFLKVERPGAYHEHEVKAGLKSAYDYFASVQNQKLLVMNGHVDLLKSFGASLEKTKTEFTEQEIDDFLEDVKNTLPFEPYDFQIKAFKESLLNCKQINKMCTSCLDGDTEIEIICDDYTDEELKKILEKYK